MTGLRLGESLGLEWDDLETDKHLAHIRRTVDDKTGAVGTPKGGKSRDVDINAEVVAALRHWKVQQVEKSLREGRGGALPARVFPMLSRKSGAGANLVRAVFKRVLKKARLPEYFTPHSARHTYATILLSEDCGRLVYVRSRARGHRRDRGYLRQVATEGRARRGGHPLHKGLPQGSRQHVVVSKRPKTVSATTRTLGSFRPPVWS